jgi:hypothetical protein
MLDRGLKSLIEEYNLGIEFSEFRKEESYEYEDVIIPFRLYLEDYPEALDEIVGADERLIKGYEKLKEGSYLKEILTPIYKLAKKNVEEHLEIA